MREDLTPPDLDAWQRLFEDEAYWQQSPDSYYMDLQRLADDLLGRAPLISNNGRRSRPGRSNPTRTHQRSTLPGSSMIPRHDCQRRINGTRNCEHSTIPKPEEHTHETHP